MCRLIRRRSTPGIWVVCDRFADSTLAYQGYGQGMALDRLGRLHRFALGDFTPDLTLILDLPVEMGLARAAARPTADRFERLDQSSTRGCGRVSAESPSTTRALRADRRRRAIAQRALRPRGG